MYKEADKALDGEETKQQDKEREKETRTGSTREGDRCRTEADRGRHGCYSHRSGPEKAVHEI